MATAEEIRSVWGSMSKGEQDGFVSNLSEDEAGKLADTLTKQYGFSEKVNQRSGELGTGVNQGISSILGLPVDTVQNVMNLAKAGFGTAAIAAGRSDLVPNIDTSEKPFLGSRYIEDKLSGFMPNQNPQDTTGRMLQTIGRYTGSSVVPVAGTARGMRDVGSGLTSAVLSGLGGGTAREMYPDNPVAEIIGSFAAPMAAYGAQSGVRGLIRGGETSRAGMADNINAFERAGSSPSVGTVATGGLAHPAESLLGRSPGSIRVISRKAQKVQDELGATAQTIAIGKSQNIEPSQAGRSIQSGVESFVQRFKDGWSKYDDKVNQFFSTSEQVSVSSTKDAALKLNKVIAGAEKTSGELTTARVSSISKKLIEDIGDKGTLPYQAIRELRSVVGENLANSGLTTDVTKGQWKLLYKSLSEDLQKAASTKGAGAVTALNRSNRYYSSGLDRIDNLLTRYSKTNTPEQAYSYAIQGSAQGATKLFALRKSISKDQFSDVVATVTNNLGKSLPGKQNEYGDAFSTERFLTNYMTLHPRAKDALFGSNGTLRSDLDNLAKVSAKIRESGSIYSNPSGTGLASGTIGASGVAIGATLSGNIAVPAGIIGWMTTNNAAARLLVNNPKFVKWLAKSTEIKPEKSSAYAARLNSIIQETNNREDKKTLRGLQSFLEGQ